MKVHPSEHTDLLEIESATTEGELCTRSVLIFLSDTQRPMITMYEPGSCVLSDADLKQLADMLRANVHQRGI